MKIELKGISELQAKLQQNMNLSAVQMVVRANGVQMQEKAMRYAPYDTGQLRRSIGIEITAGGMTAHVEATVHYAPYQEYGTRFGKAHPFMRPAFHQQAPQFIRDLEKLM